MIGVLTLLALGILFGVVTDTLGIGMLNGALILACVAVSLAISATLIRYFERAA